MGDVTALIDRWNDGDPQALQELLAVLYPELKHVAEGLLRHEREDHTLQPTALVHEAYIRLTGLREMRLESRRHFYGAAAMAMRRILVDHARQRRAQKRGGADLEFAREGVDYADRRQRQAPHDNVARDLLAKATFNLAFAVGGEEALPHWRRTGELFEAALAEKPDDPQRQRNVALVEKYVGAVLDGVDRDIEALAHYRRALELDEQRYARDPDNRLVQFDLAIDLANVAAILAREQKLDDAYAMFSKSLELRQKLSASDPMDALAKGRVGLALTRLATIDTQLARYPSAVAHAREAVRIQERIAATTKDVQSRREFAQVLYILGRAEAAAGMRGTACARLQQASSLFEALPAARSDKSYPESAARDAAACKAGRPIGGAGK